MTTKVEDYLLKRIAWEQGTDPEYPYVADLDGERCVIRLNNFPDDNLYTLLVNNAEVSSFDDWPEAWKRPDENPVVNLTKKDLGGEVFEWCQKLAKELAEHLPQDYSSTPSEAEIQQALQEAIPSEMYRKLYELGWKKGLLVGAAIAGAVAGAPLLTSILSGEKPPEKK